MNKNRLMYFLSFLGFFLGKGVGFEISADLVGLFIACGFEVNLIALCWSSKFCARFSVTLRPRPRIVGESLGFKVNRPGNGLCFVYSFGIFRVGKRETRRNLVVGGSSANFLL
jgi:hypothetical protein